jgi:23S rRNA pseudouridine2605 synthase
MRINQFLAISLGISRRKANDLINSNKIVLNSQVAKHNDHVSSADKVTLRGNLLQQKPFIYIAMNKPTGYITSRTKQGMSPTIYDLIPKHYHNLKPVGRLDKNSCGLLLLTNNGHLAQLLSHPSYKKEKRYRVKLNKALNKADQKKINSGIDLPDGKSYMKIIGNNQNWTINMHQGRNRQIRRTFASLGYEVVFLQRTNFGPFNINQLKISEWEKINQEFIINNIEGRV